MSLDSLCTKGYNHEEVLQETMTGQVMNVKKSIIKLLYCSLLAAVLLIPAGCHNQPPAPPANENPSQSAEPVSGGTLRIISPSGPNVLSDVRSYGPGDAGTGFPGVEALFGVTAERTLEPVLAEQVDEDPDNLTITVKIREGIHFHDGSELTAEVVKWNIELLQETGRLDYQPLLRFVEISGDYTLIFHLNEWNNQLLDTWGTYPIYSREAFEAAAGGDLEKGLQWARTNLIGTGPFKLDNWARDLGITWVRFEDYWQGPAQVDRIEIRYISDPAAAAAMLIANEADIWLEAPAQAAAELADYGFIQKNSWSGIQYCIIPNTASSESVLADKRVREAIEYAVDKQGLCNVIGYPGLEPLHRIAPRGHWGSSNSGREYDVQKARELLAEAGYGGLKLKLLALAGPSGRNETAEAVANFLKDAGFHIELDIASPTRFFSSVWISGWDDLLLMFFSTDRNYLISAQRFFGAAAPSQLQSLAKPWTLQELLSDSLTKRSEEEKQVATEEIVRYLADEALIIPLYNSPDSVLIHHRVHTSYPDQGNTRWIHHDMWLE